MDFKKLLNEECSTETKAHILEEATTGQKRMYIEGPFLMAEERNRNGRIYPLKIIEREVKKFQSMIEGRESLGALNHPDTLDIDPITSAILITELKMDGNVAMGKAKVLSTPNGKILESLINDGVRMGVSSRGTGNLLEDNIVAEDFEMRTIDAVYMPSAQVAYTDAIYESVQRTTEWVLNEATGLYVEKPIVKEATKTVEETPATETVVMVTDEQAAKMETITKQFNKKIDRKGRKEIVESFKELFKSWNDILRG